MLALGNVHSFLAQFILYLSLVSRLRMSGTMPPFHHKTSLCAQGKFLKNYIYNNFLYPKIPLSVLL
jgi:hypothetical protein